VKFRRKIQAANRHGINPHPIRGDELTGIC
jgi:hypothetical protein